MVLPYLVAAHRRILTWSKGFRTIPLGQLHGNFDYINCRGIDLIESLNIYVTRERRDYFLTILMFKAIHGIALMYFSDRIVMNFDVNGYDTRGLYMDLYLPTPRKDAYRNSCIYMRANCGMNCLNLYKILRILNHLDVTIKCKNLSLAHDKIYT